MSAPPFNIEKDFDEQVFEDVSLESPQSPDYEDLQAANEDIFIAPSNASQLMKLIAKANHVSSSDDEKLDHYLSSLADFSLCPLEPLPNIDTEVGSSSPRVYVDLKNPLANLGNAIIDTPADDDINEDSMEEAPLDNEQLEPAQVTITLLKRKLTQEEKKQINRRRVQESKQKAKLKDEQNIKTVKILEAQFKRECSVLSLSNFYETHNLTEQNYFKSACYSYGIGKKWDKKTIANYHLSLIPDYRAGRNPKMTEQERKVAEKQSKARLREKRDRKAWASKRLVIAKIGMLQTHLNIRRVNDMNAATCSTIAD